MIPKLMLAPDDTSVPLEDFYLFKQAFSTPETDSICAMGDELPVELGTAGGSVDLDYRSAHVSWIDPVEEGRWLWQKIGSMFVTANRAMWNAAIHSMDESLQFSSYQASDEGKFEQHMDVGRDASRRKLSMSVLLSDPVNDFTGGGLDVITGRNPKPTFLEKGDAVVFPSFLLHRVNLIQTGTRKSLVAWAHGTPWK